MTYPCRGNPTQDEIDEDNRRDALSPEERQKEDDHAEYMAGSESRIGCILAIITIAIIIIIYCLKNI